MSKPQSLVSAFVSLVGGPAGGSMVAPGLRLAIEVGSSWGKRQQATLLSTKSSEDVMDRHVILGLNDIVCILTLYAPRCRLRQT